MSLLERRRFLLLAGGSLAITSGCGNRGEVPDAIGMIDDKIASADTDELRHTRLALRGYELVSYTLGSRVLFLPYPGMRILSVAIIASGIVAKLAIEYIDEELIRRHIEEELSPDDRAKVESDGYVAFTTQSGVTEKAFLAPTQY